MKRTIMVITAIAAFTVCGILGAETVKDSQPKSCSADCECKHAPAATTFAGRVLQSRAERLGKLNEAKAKTEAAEAKAQQKLIESLKAKTPKGYEAVETPYRFEKARKRLGLPTARVRYIPSA